MPSLRAICFLLVGFILSCAGVRADAPAPTNPAPDNPSAHIHLKGYEKVNGTYVFQLYFDNRPANQQPGPKKMGDPVGWKDYVVGPFSLNTFKTSVGDAPPTLVDVSTLELIDPKTNRKIVLTYRQ